MLRQNLAENTLKSKITKGGMPTWLFLCSGQLFSWLIKLCSVVCTSLHHWLHCVVIKTGRRRKLGLRWCAPGAGPKYLDFSLTDVLLIYWFSLASCKFVCHLFWVQIVVQLTEAITPLWHQTPQHGPASAPCMQPLVSMALSLVERLLFLGPLILHSWKKGNICTNF